MNPTKEKQIQKFAGDQHECKKKKFNSLNIQPSVTVKCVIYACRVMLNKHAYRQ